MFRVQLEFLVGFDACDTPWPCVASLRLAPSEAHSYGAPEEGPLTARSASARSGRSAPSMRSMGAGGTAGVGV